MKINISNEGIILSKNETPIEGSSLSHRVLMKEVSSLDKSSRINKKYSSYKLKHIFERMLKEKTNNEISYISNGEFILTMLQCGFRMERCSNRSKNAYFNLKDSSLKKFEKYF